MMGGGGAKIKIAQVKQKEKNCTPGKFEKKNSCRDLSRGKIIGLNKQKCARDCI